MESAPQHLTTEQLEDGMTQVLASPSEQGTLRQVFARPQANARTLLTEARLSPESGLEGDRWSSDHWQHLDDGSPDPSSQISLMNSRILELIASGDPQAMGLAGDNLIVDLDLSEQNLPTGSRLQIGDSVVVEISAVPHTGCKKFAQRYGEAAKAFINGPAGKAHNLRGRLGKIVAGGVVQVGDPVVKVTVQ